MNLFTTRLDDKLNGVLIAAAAAMLIASNVDAIRASDLMASTVAAARTALAPIANAPLVLASR